MTDTGYVKFALSTVDGTTAPALEVKALLIDGPASAGAHFNLEARRNAASVHLRYPFDSTLTVTGFYTEVTAVDDPVATYYMATGFARGYFGMQVNSPTERRIIFSVWDAANGANAKDRSTVSPDNFTQLVAKGEGVVAEVFGNEGTGGHSHLVYNWKTQGNSFKGNAVLDGPEAWRKAEVLWGALGDLNVFNAGREHALPPVGSYPFDFTYPLLPWLFAAGLAAAPWLWRNAYYRWKRHRLQRKFQVYQSKRDREEGRPPDSDRWVN